MSRVYNGPCGDPTCYRGAEGSGGPGGAMVYKDGPCQAPDCQWPKDLKPRPHYTDNPATPILDAGKVAREERETLRALVDQPDSVFSAAIAAYRPNWRGHRLSLLRQALAERDPR